MLLAGMFDWKLSALVHLVLKELHLHLLHILSVRLYCTIFNGTLQ